MKITDLVLLEVTGSFPVEEVRSEERIVNPLDAYPEFGRVPWRASSHQPGDLLEHRDVYLEVRTDEGITGLFGPVDGPHVTILRDELRGFVVGRDPLAIEAIWDLLLRRNRHARAGYYMMAMSALDCALWDLKGKALGLPVYRLLGGPTQQPVRAYASMLGFSLEAEALARRAQEYAARGFHAQKWFFRYGPGDGPEGAARNVALVRLLREALGEEAILMFDAFNSWDVPYAVDIGKRIARYRPAWLEEPLPIERVTGLRAIRERTGVPVATGEHVYTRWGVRELLEAEAVDVVQADPDWCGGISELLEDRRPLLDLRPARLSPRPLPARRPPPRRRAAPARPAPGRVPHSASAPQAEVHAGLPGTAERNAPPAGPTRPGHRPRPRQDHLATATLKGDWLRHVSGRSETWREEHASSRPDACDTYSCLACVPFRRRGNLPLCRPGPPDRGPASVSRRMPVPVADSLPPCSYVAIALPRKCRGPPGSTPRRPGSSLFRDFSPETKRRRPS